MLALFGVFILSLLVITAVGIVRASRLFGAVLLSGLFSLQMAAMFFILDAADVALTEAAVGAGVATMLLLAALALLDVELRQGKGRRWLAVTVAGLATLLMIYATLEMPLFGDPLAPAHQHLASWYLSETPELIDVPNVVTAILASFRGYDTLGELFVIFTAGVGVLLVMDKPRVDTRYASLPSADVQGLRHHLVPRVVGRLLVPFIVLFGLYVQFHGDFGPGGGFQAGALVSAGLILYSLLEGERAALAALPLKVLKGMIAAGALLYAGVGIAGMLMGGNFLDYSVLGATPVAGQHLGILLVELGVGLTVTGVILTIFHTFAARVSER